MATAPTTEVIKAYLRNEKPTEDDTLYGEALNAAIRTICDATQRNFTVAGSAAPRSFRPNRRSDYLYIGDCTAVTSVVENSVALTVGTSYQLEPLQTTNWAGMTQPYNALRRLDAWWYTNGPRATVVVTAAWGWASIPDRIVEAIKILTKDIIENRDARGGLISFQDAGLASVRMNRDVAATIDAFRGPMSWGIA